MERCARNHSIVREEHVRQLPKVVLSFVIQTQTNGAFYVVQYIQLSNY